MKEEQTKALESLIEYLSCGLFYTAPTLKKGVEAAHRLQEASGSDKVGAITAMGILNNSIAQELKRILEISS